MRPTRIIARLDIKGPNLVKGIHLEGLRVLGRPSDFAKYYYESGADELIYMDVVASLYNRNSLQEFVREAAREIFVPFTVGGGIRTLDDIKDILRAGADKVAINTAAIGNPEFIRQAARRFGSSTIVIAIEAIRQPEGNYLAFTDNGRQFTGVDALEWASRVEELGAGEILLTSVDREGTGTGYDVALVRSIGEKVSIPILAHGGMGKLSHASDLLKAVPVSGLVAATVLHYDSLFRQKFNFTHAGEGNVDFLKSGRTFSKIEMTDIAGIKKHLIESGFECRN